jgi:methionyl-tRNA formyltransferase
MSTGNHNGRQDPLRIVFAGTPDAAVPSLAALLDSGHDVAAVVTRAPARKGRGRTLTPSPVADLATKAGIPVLTPDSARTPEFREELAQFAPEVAAVVAYGKILPQSVLQVPPHGWVNLHFSLLPAWRGASPVQAAIRAGDEITGASTFRLEAGMDTGPVFGVITERIRPADTAGELLERLAVSGSQLLVATLDGIADGTVEARPQSTDGVSVAGKVTVADAKIDWSTPAIGIDRMIRSVTPEPGAWTESPWGRMGIGPIDIADRVAAGVAGDLTPGQLSVSKNRILVGTGTTPVRLGRVIPPGRRSMDAADWARGVRPEPGTVLG